MTNINLDWIPDYIIDFTLSERDFVLSESSNKLETFITINILFLSSACLKIYINPDEDLIKLKIWLSEYISYYNNENYYLNFIIDQTLISDNDILEMKISNIFNSDNTDYNITCIIFLRENYEFIGVQCSSELKIFDYDILTHSHKLPTCFIGDACKCGFRDELCRGVYIPDDIDPFNISNTIPNKYLNIIRDIDWYNFKYKINKLINEHYKYLDLSDDEVDIIEENLDYNNLTESEEIYLYNTKHPFSRFYASLSPYRYDQSIHKEYYKPKKILINKK